MDTNEQPEPGFFRRHRIAVIVGAVVLVGSLAFVMFGEKKEPKRRPALQVMDIMPILPPPPPPPTPPPTPPPEPPPDAPKQPEFEPEEKIETPEPPKPEAPEPEPLGTNVKGDGTADGFGLSGKGGNGMIGGTGSGQGGAGSKWGRYAGMVQSRIVEALRNHRHTRSATLSLKVRVWADSTGRITRATLAGSTGDDSLDRAIQSEILSGLQLTEPPPDGMPMPIVMRITAKRPN